MVETGLNNNLSFDLLLEVIIFQLFLTHFLNSHQIISLFLLSSVYIPKFPSTHLFQYFKICYFQLLLLFTRSIVNTYVLW